MCVCVFDIPGQGSEVLHCNEIHGVLKGKVRCCSRCQNSPKTATELLQIVGYRSVTKEDSSYTLWSRSRELKCICRHIDDCEAVNIVKITIELLPMQVSEQVMKHSGRLQSVCGWKTAPNSVSEK